MKRFVDAHNAVYKTALKEIRNGRKERHWMWYIFPQIVGLGSSVNAQYYAIRDREEAEEYMRHPLLRAHLLEISEALLALKSDDAKEVFGPVDAMKLKSCMTLFYLVSGDETLKKVLAKFFDGNYDSKTIELLR